MGPIARAVKEAVESVATYGDNAGDFWRLEWSNRRGDTLPFSHVETQARREAFIFFQASRFPVLRDYTPDYDRTGMRA